MKGKSVWAPNWEPWNHQPPPVSLPTIDPGRHIAAFRAAMDEVELRDANEERIASKVLGRSREMPGEFADHGLEKLCYIADYEDCRVPKGKQ